MSRKSEWRRRGRLSAGGVGTRLTSLLLIAALLVTAVEITQARWVLAAGNYGSAVAADPYQPPHLRGRLHTRDQSGRHQRRRRLGGGAERYDRSGDRGQDADGGDDQLEPGSLGQPLDPAPGGDGRLQRPGEPKRLRLRDRHQRTGLGLASDWGRRRRRHLRLRLQFRRPQHLVPRGHDAGHHDHPALCQRGGAGHHQHAGAGGARSPFLARCRLHEHAHPGLPPVGLSRRRRQLQHAAQRGPHPGPLHRGRLGHQRLRQLGHVEPGRSADDALRVRHGLGRRPQQGSPLRRQEQLRHRHPGDLDLGRNDLDQAHSGDPAARPLGRPARL